MREVIYGKCSSSEHTGEYTGGLATHPNHYPSMLFSGNIKIIRSIFSGESYSLVPYFPSDFLPRTRLKAVIIIPLFCPAGGRDRAVSASFPFYLQMTRWPSTYGQNIPESKIEMSGERERERKRKRSVLHRCLRCDVRYERLTFKEKVLETELEEKKEERL